MYDEFSNQLIHIGYYLFSFILTMMIFPRLLFRPIDGSYTERFTAYYMKMVLFVIVSGYILVVFRLFEVIAIVAVVLLLWIRRLVSDHTSHELEEAYTRKASWMYDYLEGKHKPLLILMQKWNKLVHSFTDSISAFRFSAAFFVELVLFLAVFVGYIYSRFHDAVTTAAPALSDGYVTLAWMKHIDQRILFYDGIYPHGFHIYLDFLYKFAFIDPLYILKYTGPLNMVFVLFGFYFTVYKWTNNRLAGLVAAGSFLFFGEFLYGSTIERQSATNSQEFAFIFIWPTLYFLYKYLKEGKKDALSIAAVGMMVTGLVHALAFALLGMGVAIMLFTFLLLKWKKSIKRIMIICIWGAVSVVVALTPLFLGFIQGSSLHSSSANYLVGVVNVISKPVIQRIDMAALCCIGFLLLYFLLRRKRDTNAEAVMFTVLFGTATFSLFYYGGWLTNSILIASRSVELWALVIPVCLGMGWNVLFAFFNRIHSVKWLERGIGILAFSVAFALFPPTPIETYKMEWNAGVEQYLRISSEYRPKTWNIISQEEGYAIALGSGYHFYISDLLERYDPRKPALTRYGENKPDEGITHDIFIYFEKEIYKVSEGNAIYPLVEPIYNRREQEMAELEKWLDIYSEEHSNLEIYYEDEQLRIYHLYREETREDVNKRIWER